jgi:hypothetical protein
VLVNAVRVLDCQSNKLIDSDTLYALSLVLMDAVRVLDCQGKALTQSDTLSIRNIVLVVAVRVLDCQGNALTSNVIAGLDWLAQNFQLPAVASLSLGADSPNSAMDDAVKALIALGVTVVVAAGNFNQSKLHVPGERKREREKDREPFCIYNHMLTSVHLMDPACLH